MPRWPWLDARIAILGGALFLLICGIALGALSGSGTSGAARPPTKLAPPVNAPVPHLPIAGPPTKPAPATKPAPPATNRSAAYPPGDFVIGDENAALGTKVTFWGAKWWKLNSLSGGPTPTAFKGFENESTTAACGKNWTTEPGNSTPPPPGPLPEKIIVIVSSKISKSGSEIKGDTVHVVVVKTNPGYAPNPGHAGTGTVVSLIC
jgi:hypothetical protein